MDITRSRTRAATNFRIKTLKRRAQITSETQITSEWSVWILLVLEQERLQTFA